MSISSSRVRDSGLFSSPEKRTFVLCLLLALLTLLLYNPVSHYQFVNFDDDHYIIDNTHVRTGLSWATVSWAFTSMEESNWHPLTWLSHALDCQIFHLNPAGPHYVNLLIHISNVLLLFLLLQSAIGFPWRSFFVAAIFAVHPLNVESVAWVAERKNVLCALFFLLTLSAYGFYVRRPNVGRYIVVLAFFALGLLSKPMIVTLPFVLLLVDYWPLGRMVPTDNAIYNQMRSTPSVLSKRHLSFLVIEKIPFLGLSLVSAVITMKAQHDAIHTNYGLWTRFENALVSYAVYLEKVVVPLQLAPLYPYKGVSLSVWVVVVSGAVLIGVTIMSARLRNSRYLIVGWLWYLGILVPMIGLVQVGEQSMADRYTYIAAIGIFVMIVWGVTDWASAKELSRNILAISGLLVLVALSTLTHFQEAYWHDSFALWTHAIDVSGPNFVAEDNLANAFVQQHQYDRAIQHFRNAAKINPSDAFSELNIGVFEASHGNTKEAIADYKFALSATADARLRASALSNLGSAYRSLGDYPNARKSYESALQLRPDDAFNLIGLGITNQKTGDLDRAIEYYSRAVKAQATDVGFLLLTQSLEKSGRITEAQTAFAQAQEISNNLDSARQKTKQLLSDQVVSEPVAASELQR